jgi:hypothetical protein
MRKSTTTMIKLGYCLAGLALATLACSFFGRSAPPLAQPGLPVLFPTTSYYGKSCPPGEPRSLTVTIDMNMHYQSVTFEWSYLPLPYSGHSGYDYSAAMTENSLNPGEYSVTIHHDFDDVNSVLNGGSGVIVYEITATAPSGMMATGATEPSIEPCSLPDDQK